MQLELLATSLETSKLAKAAKHLGKGKLFSDFISAGREEYQGRSATTYQRCGALIRNQRAY